MNPFRKVVELILRAVSFRVSSRHMSAVFVLLAVMMPITVPVPIWAYDLRMPELPVNEAIATAPSAGGLSDILESFLSWATDDKKRRESRKKAGDSRAAKAENAAPTEPTVPSGLAGGKVKPNPLNPAGENAPAKAPAKPSNGLRLRSAAMFNLLPEDEHESIYSAQNNLGAPSGQTEADSSNRAAALPIKHRVGSANFSFGIPSGTARMDRNGLSTRAERPGPA